MTPHRTGTLIVALAVAGGSAPEAWAEGEGPNVPSVRVDYQGPADCPTASGFQERLATRTSNIRVVREGDTTWRLVVRVARAPRGSGTHGELSIRNADGGEARRAVDGDTCESVVDALALMSAMALDPSVMPRAAEPDAPVPAPPAAAAADVALRPDASTSLHVSAWVGGGAVFGVAPVAVPDVWAGLELAPAAGSLGSPTVRAAFDYARSGASAVSSGGAIEVARSIGVVEGCPAWWSPGSFRLAPCLRLEGGALAASGLGVTPGRSAVRPWLAVGALGSARYVPRSWLFVEISGGLHVPLVRDRFYFEPDTAVFRAPAAAGFVGGALGFAIR
jgi:hypothetical protein